MHILVKQDVIITLNHSRDRTNFADGLRICITKMFVLASSLDMHYFLFLEGNIYVMHSELLGGTNV